MAGNSILAKMAVQIVANNAKFNASMKQSQAQMRGFQKTAQTLNNTLTSFGVGFGAFELARGVHFAIKTMADFERTMSTVKAITGATGEELKALEADAMRLGAATKFTASEVAQLQVAYGRLGFTTKEILDATGATLSLAAATGEDLAKSADVAGSTVRGFGLDASETMRVVDVMASSFNKSALSLDNFTESMKYVAPIANAVGASVEETTALLGVLADSGIRGSQAGTAMRRIFAELSKDGRPLQERLEELSNKGLSLSDAFDEVGRYAQTALLVLAKNNEKAKELTHAFNNAAGSAKKMADTIEDNLVGDVTQLTSAWEGMILQFKESGGPMRDTVQNLTTLVRLFTQGRATMKLYGEHMASVNNEGERMNKWLEDMDKQAILDAFGDPSKITASPAWNPFGAFLNDDGTTVEKANEVKKQIQDTVADISAEWDKQFSIWDKKENPWSKVLDIDDATKDFLPKVKDHLAGVNSALEINSNAMEVWAAGYTARVQIAAEAMAAHQEKTMLMAENAQALGGAFGEMFGAIASGQQDLAQAMLKVTEQIITMYLRQSIAAMIAAHLKDPKTAAFPFAKIAAAAAGIGLVKSLFSGLGGNIGSGGGGGAGRSTATESSFVGETRIHGYDLNVNYNKVRQRRSRIG